MRIGIFTDTFPPEVNGVAVSTMILQKELINHNHEVFVICTNNSLINSQRDGNILRLPGVELKLIYGYVLSSPVHLLAYNDIKDMNLDIIHVQTEFGIGFFGRICGYLLKIPVVGTYHTTYEEYTHYVIPSKPDSFVDKLAKRTVKSLSKMSGDSCIILIAPSQKTKDMLQEYNIKKPIKVIPTGIDLNRFKKPSNLDTINELKNTLNIKNEFIILYVGRVAEEKSIDVIIKALPEVVKENNNIRFVVVGDGPGKNDLIKLTNKLKLSEYINYVGKVPSDDVPKFYHIADCFVSASTTETQGITYIEALSSGTITFASDREVVKDVVIEDETGYYFKDEVELSQKLITFMKLSNEKRKEMEKNSVKITSKYNNDNFYNKIITIYEEAIDNFYRLFEVKKIVDVGQNVMITLENKVEEKEILVSDEDYLEYNIRKDKVLTDDLVEELLKKEKYLKVYLACLKRVSRKSYTVKEIYDFMLKNSDLDIAEMNKIVEKLTEIGFLNDRKYITDLIDSRSVQTMSKNKIFATLKDKGLNVDLINELLDVENNVDDYSSALLLAQKILPTLGAKSSVEIRNTIKRRLANKGYNYGTVEEVLENLAVEVNITDEMSFVEKEVTKLKERYKLKYDNDKTMFKIRAYLLAKGYSDNLINEVLNKMEEEENEN